MVSERLPPLYAERIRDGILSNLEYIETCSSIKFPHLRTVVLRADEDVLADMCVFVDLLTHHIDTEEKLATKVLKDDYVKVWMKSVRRRIKERKGKK